MSTMNALDKERLVREQTECDHADECDMWLEGINLLYESFRPLDKRQLQEPKSEHVMMGTLMHAATSQQSAYLLAVTGYCVQALPLVRLSYEDWCIHWYIKNKPEDAAIILSRADQTEEIEVPSKQKNQPPTIKRRTVWVQKMLEELEKLVAVATNTPGYQDETARRWKDHVDWLSHVGFASLRRSFTVDGFGGSHIQIGPLYDKMRFLECVSEFTCDISLLLEASEMMSRGWGLTPANPGAYRTYMDRVVAWQNNVYRPLL